MKKMRLFSRLFQSLSFHQRFSTFVGDNSLKNLIISSEDIQSYKVDGVVCLRGVLSDSQCREMSEASLQFQKANKGFIRYAKDDKRFFSAAFMSDTVPIFEKFAKYSQLSSIAAQLMNNVKVVRFFYDQLFVKFPGAQARTAWHNDLSYWPFRGNDLISMWCALTPVKRESSGVEYIPGTHLNKSLYQAITPDEDLNFVDPNLKVCPDFSNDKRILSWDMNAGDVLCHHPLIIHGSGANNSFNQQRIGLSLRYLGEDVIWYPSKYVMKIPKDLHRLKIGKYPDDDKVFPPIYINKNSFSF